MTKKQILSKIKRLAKNNGDKPPGRKKFEKETGIRFYHWYPHFWLRWSEAIHEAGLTPNTLKPTYSNELIFEKLLMLTRRLKHFPSTGEMRKEHQKEPSFPSNSVFARFGSERQLVENLLLFCKLHTEFEDVISLCMAYKPVSFPKNKKNDFDKDGVVHLIRIGNFYKFGKSDFAEMTTGERWLIPGISKIIHTITTDDPRGITEYWQNRFQAKQKECEWFALDALDIKAFKRRKFM